MRLAFETAVEIWAIWKRMLTVLTCSRKRSVLKTMTNDLYSGPLLEWLVFLFLDITLAIAVRKAKFSMNYEKNRVFLNNKRICRKINENKIPGYQQ